MKFLKQKEMKVFNIFKLLTIDYWEERSKKKIQKNISELERMIKDLDDLHTKSLGNLEIMTYCNQVSGVFKKRIKDLKRRL